MKDILGQEIEVGSIVTYPGRQGSSMWMNFAVVYEIKHGTDWRGRSYEELLCVRVGKTWRGGEVSTRKVVVSCTDRILVVPESQFIPFTNEMHATLIELKEKFSKQ